MGTAKMKGRSWELAWTKDLSLPSLVKAQETKQEQWQTE